MRVLIVEDEDFVAEMRADQRYDLILRDLRMRKLDGIGLDRESERPQSGLMRRLIFVTGTTEHPDYRSFLVQADVPVLAKPFTLADVQDLTRLVFTTS